MTFVDKVLRDARNAPDPGVSDIITPDGPKIRLTIEPEGNEGRQVFEGANHEELCGKLHKACLHGSRLIRRQAQELKAMRNTMHKVLELVVALSRCENRLGPDARKVLTEISELVDTQN